MPILDSFLAFALTMLVVSSTVTIALNFMQKLAKTRSRILKKQLEDFVNTEVQPVLKREMARLACEVQGATSDAVNQIVQSHLGGFSAELLEYKADRKLANLATEDLIERLKRSDLGTGLLTRLGDKADRVFESVGKSFETHGERFTESFRTKQRRWTTVMALVLAVALNIDSIFIAGTYLRDEGFRNAAIANQAGIIENAEKAILAAEAIAASRDAKQKEDLEQAITGMKEQRKYVEGLGMPLGINYFPHACYLADDQSKTKVVMQDGRVMACDKALITGNLFMWVLGILLTGFLAGMGAPFWFDTVSSLSKLTQRMRGTPA